MSPRLLRRARTHQRATWTAVAVALSAVSLAVVTGACGGLGQALAREFIAAGACVALVGLQRPALEALARLMPEAGWPAVRKSGLQLIEKARFGLLKLPTDWVSAADGKLRPAAGFKPEFGYNAIRIPLYLAMSVPLGLLSRWLERRWGTAT